MSAKIIVAFTVFGNPVGKGRMRHRMAQTSDGREFIQGYTPKKTRNYESEIRLEAKLAMMGHKLATGPVVLIVRAFFPIPSSWSKKKQRLAQLGAIVPVVRPDWDNIGKSASDAMNSIVFRDDAVIVDSVVRKRYSVEPRIEIAVLEYNPLRGLNAEDIDPDFAEVAHADQA